MNLLIGKIEWYNDEFEIAIDDNSVNLGTNASINNMKPPPAPPIEWGKVDRPPTKKAPSFDPPHGNPSSGVPKTHYRENTKMLITVAFIGAGLVYHFLYK